MRIKLNFPVELGQLFRRLIISNFKETERTVNNIEEKFINHQVSQMKAHTSKQIDHKGMTVGDRIDYESSRISNLVVGVDGNGVKEVTDSRVSMDGEKHEVLSERLLRDFNNVTKEIDRVENKFVEINLDEYYPDKTGKTDVSNHIQHALDRIKVAKGGKLFIPAGDYLIHNCLLVYENTTISMDNNTTILRGNTNELFMNGPYSDEFTEYNGRGNIHFIGGTLDGNYEQLEKYPTQAANMVNLKHAENITFDNVRFRNVISYHALDCNGIKNLRVTNCIFEGYINLTDESMKEAIQISEYTKDGIAGNGVYDGTPCRDVIITGNTFRKSDILDSFHVGVGNHFSVHNIFQSNFTITNNTFQNILESAVRPYKWNNVRVENNAFENCSQGVRISNVGGSDKSANDINGNPSGTPQAGSLYFINNNLFSNYTKFGITIYGQQYNDKTAYVKNININANIFECDNNDVGEAINLRVCQNIHIKDNTINSGYRGIRHIGCNTIFIDKNYINNVKTEGIFNEISSYTGLPSQVRHLHITNNLINTTGRNGIFVQYAQNYFVRFNTVTNTSLQTEDDTPRGGIYLSHTTTGAVENNHLWGTEKDFAIRTVDTKNTNFFNNGGTGGVYIDGDNSAMIGYWNVSNENNINKVSTKG